MNNSHFVIVYRVFLQGGWHLSRFVTALEKTLRMRQEWQAKNCFSVMDAKDKGVFVPTLDELEIATQILNAGVLNTSTKAMFNDNDIKKATELLRSIISYNLGIHND